MLKKEKVKIPTKGCRKIQYFNSLGYDVSGDFILVKISDLNNGSRILIDVICDYCNSENKITYKDYKRNISVGEKYACSKKCGSLKAKETNLEKYGVENPMCLKETQEKTKKTNLEKYGVEYLQQSDIIREKTKKTFIKNWGTEHISKTEEFKKRSKKWMSSDEFKEKSIKTLIEKWGVDHPSKSNEIVNKSKEKKKKLKKEDWNKITNKIKKKKLEKYGDENYNNPDKRKDKISKFTKEKWLDISRKIKKTKLEKYGNENYNNSEKIKKSLSKLDWSIITKKRKETNLEKWGIENYNNSEKIKEFFKGLVKDEKDKILNKVKKTKLERYGDENYNNPEKIKESLSKLEWKSVINKRKQTLYYRYGNENYVNSEKIKEFFKNLSKNEKDRILNKSKETKLKKWGDENYNNPKKIKESLSELDWDDLVDKRKETTYKKYGNQYIFKSETFRKENYEIAKNSNYIEYLGNNISLFKCDCGNHEFEISTDNYFSRLYKGLPLCTVCNPISESRSIKEGELFNFIDSIYNGEIVQSYRDSLEIDVYLPNLNIGFEFNGLYFHSSKFRENSYHLNKTKYFKEKGIRIIHIWEDDWVNKRHILESQIKNWLGLTQNKIFARKCYIKEIKDSKVTTKFLEENHIQGKVGSSLKLGLYYEGELVSLMTFDHYEGRNKMNNNEWNINRFCNKKDYNIVGGASKLFKYFIKNYDTKRIISYSDNDWSLGSLYETLNFKKVSESDPDYKYIFDGKRVHKSRFRKSKTGISESELNMLKIWDSGKIKWEIIT